MGRAISAISGDHGCTISYPVDLGDDPTQGIDHCDVVIDFSLREATLPLARLSAGPLGKPMVIGTTGHNDEEKSRHCILNLENTRGMGRIFDLGSIYYFT